MIANLLYASIPSMPRKFVCDLYKSGEPKYSTVAARYRKQKGSSKVPSSTRAYSTAKIGTRPLYVSVRAYFSGYIPKKELPEFYLPDFACPTAYFCRLRLLVGKPVRELFVSDREKFITLHIPYEACKFCTACFKGPPPGKFEEISVKVNSLSF